MTLIFFLTQGATHSIALSDVNTLYSWGRGHAGQLGHGVLEDEETPREVEALGATGIVEICAGGSTTFSFDSEGWTYVMGERVGASMLDQASPEKLSWEGGDLFTTLEDTANQSKGPGPFFAHGGRHTLVLTKTRELFTWGANPGGQLGRPDGNVVEVPTRLPAFDRAIVRQLAAQGGHSAALVNNGELLMFGENSTGQLGNGDGPNSHIPRPVAALEGVKIKVVSCAWAFTNAVTDSGEVWEWGYKGKGDYFNQLTPRVLEGITHVSMIVCGGRHTLALARPGDDEELFSWGIGDDGQLGHGDLNDSPVPRRVEALRGKKVSQIAAGGRHSMVIAETPSRSPLP